MANVKKRHRIVLLLTVISILSGIAIAFAVFYNNMRQTMHEQTSTYLLGVAEQNAHSTARLITADLNTVESLAKTLSEIKGLNDEQMRSLVYSFCSEQDYEDMGLINSQGLTVGDDGEPLDLSKQEFFTKAMSGEVSISIAVESVSDGSYINVLSAPVFDENGKVIWVLYAIYEAAEYDRTLSMDWFSSKAELYLAKSSGEMLSRVGTDANEDIAGRLEKDYFGKIPYDLVLMKSDMSAGKRGSFLYSTDEKDWYVIYIPIPIENWYCVSVLPGDIVSKQERELAGYGLALVIYVALLMLVFSVALLIIMYQGYRSLKKTNAQIALEEERYRIVTEQSNSVVFDYDAKNKSVYHSVVFERLFGYVPPISNFPQCIVNSGLIHPEDVLRFLDAFEKCSSGSSFMETEVRMRGANGIYIWFLIRMTAMFDEGDKLRRIIGRITDVDYTKRKTAMLTKRSNQDRLTGIYNKEAAKSMVTEFIETKTATQLVAMFVIDIDNFKQVNDNLGHLAGDRCICEIAEILSKAFSKDCIVARVGGDEFIVFLESIRSNEDAYTQGRQLCEALSHCKVDNDEGADYTVTASVGVAVSKEGAEVSYEGLFHQADEAMYHSKRSGKNKCSEYHAENADAENTDAENTDAVDTENEGTEERR